MNFYKKPKPPRDIHNLAHRFLEKRYPLSRLYSEFGRKKTKAIVTDLAEVILLCDPDHQKSQEWLKRMGR